MKKSCGKNCEKIEQKTGSVEMSVDEFSVVFKFKKIEEFNELKYSLDCEELIESFVKFFKLDILGGVVESTPLACYSEGFATDDGDSSIRFSYHKKRPDMGLVTKFGGRGLKNYLKSQSNLTVSKLMSQIDNFAKLRDLELRFTRLDLALDFVDCDLNVTNIYNKLQKNLWEFRKAYRKNKANKDVIGRLSVSKEKLNAVVVKDEVQTIYLGSRELTFLRIYDKKVEQLNHKLPLFYDKAKNCKNWIRFETVFRNNSKNEEANNNAYLIIERCKNEDEAIVFRDIFVTRFNLFNVTTQKLVNWWTRLVLNGEVVYSKTSDKDSAEWQDLERGKEYFVKGNSGLQSLIEKIAIEAELRGVDRHEAIESFVIDILKYHELEYEKTADVKRYEKRMRALNNQFQE